MPATMCALLLLAFAAAEAFNISVEISEGMLSEVAGDTLTERAGGNDCQLPPASPPPSAGKFSRQACLNAINKYRGMKGLSSIKLCSAERQTLADRTVQYDGDRHAGHEYWKKCGSAKGARGQCEAGRFGSAARAVEAYWNEGPPKKGGFNHYSIMMSTKNTCVACGFSQKNYNLGNKHQTWTYAQNFYSDHVSDAFATNRGSAASGSNVVESTAGVGDACLAHVNAIRKTHGSPPYKLLDAKHQKCTAAEAKADAKSHKAHGSFPKCGEYAQGVAGGSCIKAIDAFMSEWPCKNCHASGVISKDYHSMSYGQSGNHVTVNYYYCPKSPCDPIKTDFMVDILGGQQQDDAAAVAEGMGSNKTAAGASVSFVSSVTRSSRNLVMDVLV